MRTKFVIATLLMTVLLICSCGGGSGSDSDSSAQKAVAVGFDLNIVGTAEKSISAEAPTYDDIQIWYKAIPQWTSQDGIKIQGDTRYNANKDANNFVKLTVIDNANPSNNKFTYDDPSGDVGYFAQGQWAFDIEVRKPLNAGGSAVLWKTSTTKTQYINAAGTITFTVSKNIDSTKNGTVTFDITAPKTANTDVFKVFYKLLGTDGDGTEIPSGLTKGGANDAEEATLTGSYSLPSGNYAITVKYYSSYTDAQNFALVGASTVAAEVIPDGDITVSGSIENNKWQLTAFAIKGMYKLTATVTAGNITSKDTVSVAQTGTVNFTCNPTITELDGSAVNPAPTYFYEWRVNGATVGTNSTYAWVLAAGDAHQDAYVDCIVYFKDGDKAIGSACATFLLKVVE
ncbi:MAG: hypothetical protein IJQ86_07465 [Spirochaetia bacterium]|nr:hypothetical protein [Spirochaetia bacterium]